MSYTKSYYHIVFRTYRSQRTIAEEHERGLYMYVFAMCKNNGIWLWRINSMPDHVHMLVSLPPSLSVSDFVKNAKQTMGNYMKEHKTDFPMFNGWADGYCSITYCGQERESVVSYIKNQKEHHRRQGLGDEMRALMKAAGISIKEEYFKKDWEE